jgi:hypothetical protein
MTRRMTKRMMRYSTRSRVAYLRGRKLERGQSLVEFVLALPILLVIVFGIIEFASAWRSYQVITNVAREGTRVGVTPSGDQTTVDNRVTSLLTQSGLASAPPTTTISYSCDGIPGGLCAPNAPNNPSETVQIDYVHRFVVLGPVLDLMCFGCGTNFTTITLSARTTMRNE